MDLMKPAIRREFGPLVGEIRTYIRGKLMLVVSEYPDNPGRYRVSVSHKNKHPCKPKHFAAAQDSFPPGDWENFACGAHAHHWLYEPNTSAMTKEEIDALAAEHGI